MSRKLDAKLAELLGWELKDRQNGVHQIWRNKTTGDLMMLLSYSTDGNAMLELDREMRERGWYLQTTYLPTRKQYEASCYNRERGYIVAVADTMPLAVALAAYKALTGKEWAE